MEEWICESFKREMVQNLEKIEGLVVVVGCEESKEKGDHCKYDCYNKFMVEELQ